MLQNRPLNRHSVGQNEHALKLSCGNATVQIVAFALFDLPPANDQLVFFRCDIQFVFGKSGDGQRDAQARR